MPAWGSNRLWCENCPRAVVLGTYRRAEAARTGPRTLRQQQSWRRVESDPTRVRRSGLLARGGAGHAEKVLGSRLLFSPGQPRPSEKIGRASTRGVSKHKPGAFELILSWARRQASTAIGLPACSAAEEPGISAVWVVGRDAS